MLAQQSPMILQAYTPQIHLGDWQIVVFVNRRRHRISVERWHSSQKASPLENNGQSLRIETGIRAFRRQMPVLAVALEKIEVADKSDAEIIEAVFQTLAEIYGQGSEQEGAAPGEDDFADFLKHRKQAALMALSVTVH